MKLLSPCPPNLSDTSSPRFVLDFGTAKYLINCPEGTTRSAGQRREKFRGVRAVFAGRVDSETLGGFPGFLMQIADGLAQQSQTLQLALVGPPPILHYLGTTRRYLMRGNIDLHVREIGLRPSSGREETEERAEEEGEEEEPKPVWKDENVTVFAVPVQPYPPATVFARGEKGEAHFSEAVEAARAELAPTQGGMKRKFPEPTWPAEAAASSTAEAEAVEDGMDTEALREEQEEAERVMRDQLGEGEGERTKRRKVDSADQRPDAEDGFGEFVVPLTPGAAADPPATRTASAPPTSAASPLSSEQLTTLLSSFLFPNFLPSSLSGPSAQLYRKLVVASSFPASTSLSSTWGGDPLESAIPEEWLAAAPSEGRARTRGQALIQAVRGSGRDMPRVEGAYEWMPGSGSGTDLSALTPNANGSGTVDPGSGEGAASDSAENEEGRRWGGRVACSYIFVGPSYRGKFLASAAEALGVPFGRIRGQLAAGQSVTLENGTVVTPEMVVEPSPPAPAMVYVECPTVEYVGKVVGRREMQREWIERDREGKEGKAQVRVVVHRVGVEVLRDERYVRWMNGFGKDCQHLIANQEVCDNDISIVSCAYFQLRMSTLAADIFRVPQYSLVPRTPLASFPGLPALTQPLVAGHELSLHPARPLAVVNTHKDLFHKALDGSEPVDTPTFARAVHAQLAADPLALLPPKAGDDTRIVCLGTASALPSKYRNVSSMMLQFPGPEERGIMLDAGEGTWGQMTRHFGVLSGMTNADSALRGLRLLFLSHIHGDHHMGTARLLAHRRSLLPPPEPLYVIANIQIEGYLREYSRGVEDLGLDDPPYVRIISAQSLSPQYGDLPSTSDRRQEQNARWAQYTAELKELLEMDEISTVEVRHRVKCHALICRRKDGFSFAYSADTMPCDAFVRAAQGVRLLIHEATFADDEEANAVKKTHSTARQAVTIGRRMGAEHTLLTHFSQRYPKIPALNQEAGPVPLGSLAQPGQGPAELSASPFRSPLEDHRQQQAQLGQTALPSRPETSLPQTQVSCAFDHLDIQVGQLWRMKHYMRGVLQILMHMDQLGDAENEEGEEGAAAGGTGMSRKHAEVMVNSKRRAKQKA